MNKSFKKKLWIIEVIESKFNLVYITVYSLGHFHKKWIETLIISGYHHLIYKTMQNPQYLCYKYLSCEYLHELDSKAPTRM